uniref:Uncharacterized protein n=1 Tax=Anguilla anguilla TaxID=7936 RepID=A0A0E9WHT0_ANGAN
MKVVLWYMEYGIMYDILIACQKRNWL